MFYFHKIWAFATLTEVSRKVYVTVAFENQSFMLSIPPSKSVTSPELSQWVATEAQEQ